MNILNCPAEALSADFGDIVIGNVSGKLDFKVSLGGKEILLESYSPDSTGFVYIRDMALLADMYRPENNLPEETASLNGSLTLALEFREGSQTLTRNVKIYACDLETDGTLMPENLKNIPLTRCFNKTVCPGQTEYISFYGPGAVTLVLFHTAGGENLSQTLAFASLPEGADVIHRLDVSPAAIARRTGIEESQITYYLLYKDRNCRIKFTMNPYLRPGNTFIFPNIFGAPETFTCYGDSENERK
jgi:hypothetical protein